MRNLTIKRNKSFVGCIAKMKIYIEDKDANDIVINNVSCRKLGDLKNNEEKTFEIGEEAAKVFVIADKLSKEYCNEFYELPAGEDDVYLSGKNRFNLANGNAFLFDNNDNEDVLKNRRNGSRKGLAVLIASVLVGAVVGFAISSGLFGYLSAKPEVFTGNGIRITLTSEFKETQMNNYTNCYDSSDVAVFMIKEEFALIDGFEDLTLEEYGEAVMQNNGYSSNELKTVDGLTGFEYDFQNPDTSDSYRFYTYIYKSDDAFWMVQFVTLDENIDEYGPKITEWAKSVSFE